jgi:hypothetical protein
MKRSLLPYLLSAACAWAAWADEPAPAADKDDACLSIDNRILGPRSGDRPLPLLSGDPAHGFHPACAVAWKALSPANQPLPVVGCFHGSLLQIANTGACGQGTGPLWVSTRWVTTSAELAQPQKRLAMCQQLETNAWAGTRDFKVECEAHKRELNTEAAPTASPPRAPSAPPASPAPQPAGAGK